jgi:hypothetical protein
MYTSSGPASAMASSNRASSASSPLDTGVAGPRLRRANGPPSNPYADAHLARPESILNAPPPNRGGSPYAPSPVGGSTGGRNSTDGGYSVDRKGKGRGDYLALDLEDAEGGRGGAGGGGAQGMQMQMMEEQVRTCESDSGRSRASLTPVIKTVPTSPLLSSGQLHPVALDRDRDDRVDDRRARDHLLATCAHGGRAARDGPAHRRRHNRHPKVRRPSNPPLPPLLTNLCTGPPPATSRAPSASCSSTMRAFRPIGGSCSRSLASSSSSSCSLSWSPSPRVPIACSSCSIPVNGLM